MKKFTSVFRFSSTQPEIHDNPPPSYDDVAAEGVNHLSSDSKHVKLDAEKLCNEDAVQQTLETQTLSDDPDGYSAASDSPETLITIKIENHVYTAYQVSRSKLCAESRYFRGRLRAMEPDVDTIKIRLDQPEAQVFDKVVHWFNTGRLPEYWHEGGSKGNKSKTDAIGDLYKTARHLRMTNLINNIIDVVKELYLEKHWNSVPSSIWRLHEKELQSTPLYRFHLDLMVYNLMTRPETWLRTDQLRVDALEKMWKNQALTEIVMKRVLEFQVKPWSDPRKQKGCAYHDHSDGCKNFKK